MGRMSDTIGNYNFTLKNRRLICFIDLKKGEFYVRSKVSVIFCKIQQKVSIFTEKRW